MRPILSWAKRLEQPRPNSAKRSWYPIGSGVAITLLTTVLFLGSLAFSYSAVENAVSKYDVARGDAALTRSRAWPTVETNQIQTLILGSSHTANGLAVAEFPETTYNLAFGAGPVVRLPDSANRPGKAAELEPVLYSASPSFRFVT